MRPGNSLWLERRPVCVNEVGGETNEMVVALPAPRVLKVGRGLLITSPPFDLVTRLLVTPSAVFFSLC